MPRHPVAVEVVEHGDAVLEALGVVGLRLEQLARLAPAREASRDGRAVGPPELACLELAGRPQRRDLCRRGKRSVTVSLQTEREVSDGISADGARGQPRDLCRWSESSARQTVRERDR